MRAVLFSLLLVGCATKAPEPPVAVDKECLAVAKYARGIANLRDVGVKREDLTAFTSEPTAVLFPLQAIQFDVFVRPELDGEQTAKRYYDRCTQVGYFNLLGALREDERTRQRDVETMRPAKQANAEAISTVLKAGAKR